MKSTLTDMSTTNKHIINTVVLKIGPWILEKKNQISTCLHFKPIASLQSTEDLRWLMVRWPGNKRVRKRLERCFPIQCYTEVVVTYFLGLHFRNWGTSHQTMIISMVMILLTCRSVLKFYRYWYGGGGEGSKFVSDNPTQAPKAVSYSM